MTDMDEQQNFSDEEKKKKQAEIAKRLAEIKTKLSGKSEKKEKPTTPRPDKKQTPTNPAPAEPVSSGPATTTPPSPAPTPTPQASIPEKKEETENKKENIRPTPPVKEQKQWSANQPKPAAGSPRKPFPVSRGEIEIRPLAQKKNKLPLLLLSLTALLVLAAGAWYFFFYETAVSTTEEALAEPFVHNIEEGMNDKDAEEEAEDVAMVEEPVLNEGAVVNKTSETTTIDKSGSNDPWGLTRPAYIISYVATSSENNAKKQRKLLSSKGFSTGYYWIPDYLPSGPSLYKVYIGPYASKTEAKNALLRVKGLRKDAYVQYVK